ncbi:MAG: alpha/beta hydrolase [Candidatus Omnitrophota bacterium]
METLLWLIVFISLFLIAIRYIETHSIFYPMKEMIYDPSLAGLVYEDVYFNTGDNIKLNGWFVKNDNAEYTLLLFHGNAGNISHRIDKLAVLNDLDVNVFIFDFRGYGKSKGKPSEQGLYKDGQAAYDYLIKEKNIQPEKIILYGASLGAGGAIDLAKKVKVKALITESAFTSVKDMARIAYPIMPPFVFSSKFNAISKSKDITYPKLLIHSIDDEIVPFRLAEKLFNAASDPKKLLKLHGGHNTMFLDSEKEYKSGIKEFLEGL